MLDLFLTGPYVPFTISLALLFGLLALELVFALMGSTVLGAGGEGVDTPEVDAPDLGDLDIDIDLDGLDIDAGDLELAGFDDIDVPDGSTGYQGIAGWLGFGKMPALIWLAAVFMAFGVSGLAIQSIFTNFIGTPLPALAAAAPSAAAALWFARSFGALFARVLPKSETQSLSERHLGRRQGVVTQGTAARGRPAEVKVIDRYGNPHYLRAEPLRDEVEIPQGSDVIVLRHKYDSGYLLVPLTL